ncbi:hypothetical protein KSX_95300 [Ktedonospora formicarum]|uniref:Uncharacterized protein n=1 Tax=Ktedonospora formicarum TaxID=2778364 RepID=A0A8J3IEM4_9CHLR|nr:hypothetical protein KSX_95300 [Ktedonospora formicarum]
MRAMKKYVSVLEQGVFNNAGMAQTHIIHLKLCDKCVKETFLNALDLTLFLSTARDTGMIATGNNMPSI